MNKREFTDAEKREIQSLVFGWMGSRTSEKKAAAARKNGRKGGRPHKPGKVSARTLARRRARKAGDGR